MVLWGGTLWLSPPIALHTPGFGWGSTSPSRRAQLAPAPAQLSHSGAERRKLMPQCIPWRGPAPQWRGDATRGGHGSGGAAGPLCLAELCWHGELAAGVAARDLSGQDLLLPDKPAAGTSSAPRGAAPSSSLPPTAAPRGQLHGSHRWAHTGHWPMLPAQLPLHRWAPGHDP